MTKFIIILSLLIVYCNASAQERGIFNDSDKDSIGERKPQQLSHPVVFKVNYRNKETVIDYYCKKINDSIINVSIGDTVNITTSKYDDYIVVDYVWTEERVDYYIIQTVPTYHNFTKKGVEGLENDTKHEIGAVTPMANKLNSNNKHNE